MALDHTDITQNQIEALELANMCRFTSELPIFTQLLDFTTRNGITLNNLTNTERFALIAMLKKGTLDEQAMKAWAENLYDARSGKGAHTDLYANQATDITGALLNGNQYPYNWGSDRDFHTLLDPLTHDTSQRITKAGTYLMPPIGFNELEKTLPDYLELGFSNNILPVTLLLPVVKDGTHWELLIASLDHTGAHMTLWDSTSNNDPERTDAAIVQSILDQHYNHSPNVKINAVGVQTNGHSCMDYVVREVLDKLNIDNAITQAENPQDLRTAICETLVDNSEELQRKYPDGLKIVDAEEGINNEINVDTIHAILKDESNRNFQIEFDEIFAKELNTIYKTDDIISDEAAEKQARITTFKRLAFFGQPDDANDNVSDVNDNHGNAGIYQTM